MANAFVKFMVYKLAMLIHKKVGMIWGIDKKMERLSSLLSTIQAVLEDAEEKQLKSKALQNWLRKLKAVAYKIEDILDDCATEAARLESYGQDSSFINKLHNILFRYKIGSRIRDISKRFVEVAEEHKMFNLTPMNSK